MARLKFFQVGIVTALILMVAAGAFSGLQFYVKWGGECAYGERYARSSQTFGFPAPAIRVHSIYDRDEADPFQRNSLSYSIEPDGAALNLLALAAVLIFIRRVAERILPRGTRVKAIETGTTARSQHRPLFRRA